MNTKPKRAPAPWSVFAGRAGGLFLTPSDVDQALKEIGSPAGRFGTILADFAEFKP